MAVPATEHYREALNIGGRARVPRDPMAGQGASPNVAVAGSLVLDRLAGLA